MFLIWLIDINEISSSTLRIAKSLNPFEVTNLIFQLTEQSNLLTIPPSLNLNSQIAALVLLQIKRVPTHQLSHQPDRPRRKFWPKRRLKSNGNKSLIIRDILFLGPRLERSELQKQSQVRVEILDGDDSGRNFKLVSQKQIKRRWWLASNSHKCHVDDFMELPGSWATPDVPDTQKYSANSSSNYCFFNGNKK